MLTIGITGGIGSGKSTVTSYLLSLGYNVIDADGISRSLTADGSPVIDELAKSFGDVILDSERVLNRKKLAEIVFSDSKKKALLESIVTKRVLDIAENQIEELRNSNRYDIIFFDAPILFESGGDKLVDKVWVVTAESDIRIKRVMERDGAAREDVIKRINNQMNEETRKAKADEIIDNSYDLESLYKQVDRLIQKYV